MLSLGIDISKNCIKYALTELKGKKVQLLTLRKYEIDENEKNENESHLGETLRSIYQEFKSSNPKIALSIPQKNISVRKKDFPFKEKSKIQKNIQFEMSDDVVFADPHYSFKITQYTTTPITYASVAITSKKHIQKYNQLCKAHNVPLNIITGNGFAINNLEEDLFKKAVTVSLEDSSESTKINSCQMILYLGNHNSFCVLRRQDQSLEDISNILWGNEIICENLQKKFKLSYKEAYEYTRNFSLNNRSHTENKLYMECVQSSLMDFLTSLKLKLKKWESQRLIVDLIQITGPSSQMANMSEWLQSQINTPIRMLMWDEKISVKKSLTPEERDDFSLAVGLSMENFKNFKNPSLNFLTGKFASDQKEKPFEKIASILYPAFFIISCSLLLLFYGIVRENITKDSSKQIYKEMKKAASFANIKGVLGFRKKVKKYIKENITSDSLEKKPVQLNSTYSALDILSQVSQILLSSLSGDIHILKIEEDTLEIKAQIDSGSDVNELKSKLKNISSDQKVDEIQLEKGLFHVQIKINRFKK